MTTLTAPVPAELLERMRQLDFAPVINTLVRDSDMTRDQATMLLPAFQQWFAAIPRIETGRVYVMLKTSVDEVFHACILNTAFYRNLTHRVTGRFVDHTPIDSQTISELHGAVPYTIDLLERLYGDELHSALRDWRRQYEEGTYVVSCADCGTEPPRSGQMPNTVVGRLDNGVRIVH